MNWVKVSYPTQRKVYVGGVEIGSTNRLLYIGEDATLRFDLGEPLDYKPKSQLRRVEGYSRARPLIIVFEPIT